jgi:sulfane dehydrogenase subunit SoxC
MINISLNRAQVEALWSIAQSARISQSEFLDTLNDTGASGILAKCIKNGTLISDKPAKAEMNFELMANMKYLTTSNSIFYTHGHSTIPSVDIKNWRLSVEGDGVRKPFSINYDGLLKLPTATYTRYLECAGNGRIFYDLLMGKKAAGQQWHFGGFGIAEWTGVQLSEILKIAEIKKEAVEVRPIGLDNSFAERPIPVAKAMEEDTLLAYIMNGTVLPPDHGFPLRAVVPGWIGAASTKWVNKIIVSSHSIHAIEKNENVLIGPDYPSRPEITAQVMKSACCLPWPALLRAGHQKIVGYAWSSSGRIAKVDISLDGGFTFQPAALTGPNIERAGTRWEFCFDAQPGNLTITPRATDDTGDTQYDISRQKWNELGYLFGAMTPHPVTISADNGESPSEENECTIVGAGCC